METQSPLRSDHAGRSPEVSVAETVILTWFSIWLMSFFSSPRCSLLAPLAFARMPVTPTMTAVKIWETPSTLWQHSFPEAQLQRFPVRSTAGRIQLRTLSIARVV